MSSDKMKAQLESERFKDIKIPLENSSGIFL
jgi:hypothetical protein